MTNDLIFEMHMQRTGNQVASVLLTLASALRAQTDRSLNVEEAADFLGVSSRTIGELVRSGKLPHHRVGASGRGRLLFTRADLIDFRERETVKPITSRLSDHIR